jgi:hypothetical protein
MDKIIKKKYITCRLDENRTFNSTNNPELEFLNNLWGLGTEWE